MANLLFNQFDGNSYSSYYGDINPSINKELNFNQNRLTNIGDPIADEDAVSKKYFNNTIVNLGFQKITIGRIVLDHLLNDSGQLGINAQDIPLEILQKAFYLELNYKNIIFESIPSGSTLGIVCGGFGSIFSESDTGIYGVPQPSDPTPAINIPILIPFRGQKIYKYKSNNWGLEKQFSDITLISSKESKINWIWFVIGRNYYCSGEVEVNLIYSLQY